MNTTAFPPSEYVPPYLLGLPISWSIPPISESICPQIQILGNTFQNVIGFPSGYYPAGSISDGTYEQNPAYTGNQIFLSTLAASILPSYVPVYYKPSNPQFANQGAVDSGALIDRKRYNTITTSAATMSAAWGNQTSDALAYGVNPTGTNITAKIMHGIPIQKTPKFNPRTGQMQQ